jgi:hypothetical protein
MKTREIKLKILAILVLLLNNSCIDFYKISTTVNADGSLERTIQVVCDDDSTTVFEGNLKVPDDTSWTISSRWFYSIPDDTTSERKYEYTASKHFNSVDELNNYLKIENDTTTLIKIESNFDKKFRWFYTYITYKETYRKSLPYEYYKPEDFFSGNELSYLYDDEFIYVREYDSLVLIKDLKQIPQLNHQDSVRMEELENKLSLKLSDFLGRNIYEDFYNYLASTLEKSNKKKYTYLVENKDDIYNDSQLGQIFSNLVQDESNDPFDRIAAIIGLPEDSIKNLNPSAYKIFETKIENTANLFKSDEDFKNSITMPGLLLNTNADSISDGKTYWNYNEHYFYLNDYHLYAESRIINKWAFAITGIVTILLLFFLFFRRKH